MPESFKSLRRKVRWNEPEDIELKSTPGRDRTAIKAW
jgi:hypothetical protein